jgi:hypothetical protein
MRIIKIILVFVAIYFIRRFIQMYRIMKAIQEQQAAEARGRQDHGDPRRATASGTRGADPVIDADFKVVD